MSNKYPGGVISLGGPESNSVYFNGASSQYLTVPKNAALEPATSGAWTLETWVYCTNNTAGILQLVAYANPTVSSGPDLGYFLTLYPGNYISGGFYSGGSSYAVQSTSAYATIGSWQHIALVSTGTTMSLYVNGTSVGTPLTVTGVSINAPSSALFKIGSYNSNQYLYGYVSNNRFVKGTAVYTANFVPPTGPLQNISGTSLLTCQSPTIIDNSSNAFTVTNNNAAVVSPITPFTAYNPNTLNPALGAATNGVWTIDEALNAETNRSWPMYDPYYNQVVLNLHGNQPGGVTDTTNNTFLDSSSNNFTITRNGNTTQGAFNPYRQSGYWGNYFDGSSKLSLASNASLALGSGDFTIEFWVYLPAYTSNRVLSWGTTSAPILYFASGYLYYDAYGGSNVAQSTVVTQLNTWTHCAVSRSSGTTKIYINGVQGASVSDSNNWTGQSGIYVGVDVSTTYLTGYLSNLRILKGTGLYTASFTPPTTPLQNITNTLLLTCQSNRFIDNSTANGGSGFAITASGTPTVQAFQPFNQNLPYESSRLGGSGYFDGSGDYLSVPNSTNLDLGSSDFTIEGWWYPTSNANQNLIAKWWTGGSQWVLQWRNAGYFRFAWNSSSTADYTTTLPLNAWCHFAIVRSGSNLNFYFNGVKNGATGTIGTLTSTTDVCTIGQFNNSGSEYTSGYLTDMRVTKGGALYTATFTPPTAPLTTTVSSGTVQLLTSTTNAGIFDNAAMNDLETASTAAVSTTQSKYGGAAMYFNGPGNYLNFSGGSTAWYNTFGFGSGAWTFECWVYTTNLALSGGNIIYGDCDSGTNNGTYTIAINGSGQLTVFQYTSSTNGTSYTTTAAMSANTWNHVAISKNGASAYLSVNGVVQAFTMSASAAYSTPPYMPYIASQGAYTSRGFQGYIDDIRVTKGVTRYTSNFQPPTSQLQDQ